METNEKELHPDLKLFVKNKDLVSKRVNDWIGNYSKSEIARMLNISRPTLNSRLKKNNWKYIEIASILKNMPF